MFKPNNNRTHHWTQGMLAGLLLLGTNAMAQDNSLPAPSINDWQSMMTESLTNQLQQPSEPLIAIKPVASQQSSENFWQSRAPRIELPAHEPAYLRSTLHGWKPRLNISRRVSQVKG